MKWNKPKLGDTRVILRYLFLPRSINGETRWLELTRIKQVRCSRINGSLYWKDERWEPNWHNYDGVF